MILGRDMLRQLGLDICFSDDVMIWKKEIAIPMKDPRKPLREAETFYAQELLLTKDDPLSSDTDRIRKILDAKYEPADLDKVVAECDNLDDDKKLKLRALLEKHKSLFDGSLGLWKNELYHVELQPGAKPVYRPPFPIPKIHEQAVKVEIERLVQLGVLKKINNSQWGFPCFVIPKKDGTVRFINDFRELNKRIVRKPYPIPKIADMLQKIQKFRYATSLDLNMGFYHIELSPETKKMCTIVLPWGKYEMQRLPMGLSNSPDVFQEKMGNLMADLEYVLSYIDDLCIQSGDTFEDHLEKVDVVLGRCAAAGLKVNARKSKFGAEQVEYLGHMITKDGVTPVKKKLDAILDIDVPKTKKQLRRFVGMVNYYRDMWPRRSHLLRALTRICGPKSKFDWGPSQQEAFDAMKKTISRDTMLRFPDFTKPFEIHTDASHYQLGAVISQEGRPIAFFSRTLSDAQTRYTTTERELLAIVETLKEYRNILLGHQIIVHTDHKNLTFKEFNTDRVLRWRLIAEEYGPEIRYIKGEKNVVADALSRLDTISSSSVKSPEPLNGSKASPSRISIPRENAKAESRGNSSPDLSAVAESAECFASCLSTLFATNSEDG
jgi:hypothetical protein